MHFSTEFESESVQCINGTAVHCNPPVWGSWAVKVRVSHVVVVASSIIHTYPLVALLGPACRGAVAT